MAIAIVAVCVLTFAVGGGVAAAVASARASQQADAAAGDPIAQRRIEVVTALEDRYYRNLDDATINRATAAPGLEGLPTTLGDPYTRYMAPAERQSWQRSDSGQYVGVGIIAAQTPSGVAVSTVIDRGAAQAAGVQVGDLITSVDGAPVSGQPLPAVLDRLRGQVDSTVTVGWTHQGQPRQAPLRRAQLAEKVVTSHLDDVAGRKVGVIDLTAFDGGVGQQVRDSAVALRAQGARMLALDLRGNGGGLVAEARRVAGAFLPADTGVFTERGANIDTTTYATADDAAVPDLPLAVLVDKDSASAAEIVAGALRDAGRARLVGTHTFGKGVIQDVVPLADGGAVKLTIAEYLTPKGTVIDHRGLEPDTVVTAPAAPPGAPDAAVIAAAGTAAP